MNKAFLSIVFLCFCFSGMAQKKGFNGKRLVGKIELIEGSQAFFSGISVEGIIHRRLTVTAGVKRYNHKIRQSYVEGEYIRPLNLTIEDKADVTTNAVELGLRLYHGSLFAIPAPDGWFSFFNVSYGQIDVNNGNYYLTLISAEEQNGFFTNNSSENVEYTYQNINFYSLEFGLGIQKLINSWFTIGCSLGVNYNKMILDNAGLNEDVFSGVAKNYGSNLYTVPPFDQGRSKPFDSNYGLSFNVQLGIILF